MKRLPYFHATLQVIYNEKVDTINVVDQNGHPYISQRILKEAGYEKVIVLSWQEITKEEYDYFHNTINDRF